MLRGMSTYVYAKERLHPGMLDTLVRGGAQAIEIFGARGHFDYSSRQHTRELGGWFKSNSIAFYSQHAPMFADSEWGRTGSPPVNVIDREKRRRIESMDEIKRAIEVAEYAPFRFLVQHIGTSGENFEMDKFEHAITAIEHLRAFARPLHVKLLLENIPNELSTPERLLELIRAGRFEDVGICFDVGHAHMMNSVAADFAVLKEHIRSTHVHDNAADRDSHLWPGQGSIDWAEAMELLQTAPHLPPLLLEIDGENKADVPKEMVAAFQKMESAIPAPR